MVVFLLINSMQRSPRQIYNQVKQHLNSTSPNASKQIYNLITSYPSPDELVNQKVTEDEGRNIFFLIVGIPDEQTSIELIEFLIKKGADIRVRDNNKQNVLFYVAKDERKQLMKKLLENNFNLNDTDYFNENPLFYAAKYNKGIAIADLLIKYGCDVNQKDNNSQTCLFFAAGSGNLQMCQLIASKGCNVVHIDKNREKAIHYARRKGFKYCVDYLSQFKNQHKKVKEEAKSSAQTLSRKKKRETVKNENNLVYTNEEGQVHVLTYAELEKFRDINPDYKALFDMMVNPDEPRQLLMPTNDKKLERIALKILNHFFKLDNSAPFHEPVNYIALNIPDYPSVIKYPMDFGTIRNKLSFNAYEDQLQFQGDMNLVFDNCILYNGTEKELGKIALQMKMEFNAMFVKDFSS